MKYLRIFMWNRCYIAGASLVCAVLVGLWDFYGYFVLCCDPVQLQIAMDDETETYRFWKIRKTIMQVIKCIPKIKRDIKYLNLISLIVVKSYSSHTVVNTYMKCR